MPALAQGAGYFAIKVIKDISAVGDFVDTEVEAAIFAEQRDLDGAVVFQY